MVHQLLLIWFGWVEHWGYWGVFILMAMESSIIPIPSEVILPPAAFWAAQGRMSLAVVIVAGTAGSYFGSFLSYFFAKWLGRPFVYRFGKLFFLSPDKLSAAEVLVRRYGSSGIFVSRLLPVVRHLVSIPAGILVMPFLRFSGATISGAFIWCVILSYFGKAVIGGHPELLHSPEALVQVVKEKMHWFIIAILLMSALYFVVLVYKRKWSGALRKLPLS